MEPESDPIFFANPGEFHDWLRTHHADTSVLWVGYYKKATGIPSMTWPESVDEALCFGWIDGLRKSIDKQAYMIRFTPRKKRSSWSKVNIERYPELLAEGRVHPAGEAAFARWQEEKKDLAITRDNVELPEAYLDRIRVHSDAWDYFETLPPGRKRLTIWWVMSAKREATRKKRLGILLDCCREGQLIPQLRPSGE